MQTMQSAAPALTGPLILIIEDEAQIAEVVQAYLAREGFRSAYAPDGQRGLQLLQQLKPDLVLLDIRMPGQNGIDVLQAIRGQGSMPVIMLTALTDDINKLLSLRIGADDYIAKPFNPAEVIARVQAVMRRSRVASPPAQALIRLGPLVIDNAMHAAFVQSESGEPQPLALTLTEFRLLAFMARWPKRCLTRFELIDACMPESDALDRVIDSHLSNLRRKLEEARCNGLIETVRGVGYRLWPGP